MAEQFDIDYYHFPINDEVKDLVRKGEDSERVVLARAVRSHLQNRVLVYMTVVFK